MISALKEVLSRTKAGQTTQVIAPGQDIGHAMRAADGDEAGDAGERADTGVGAGEEDGAAQRIGMPCVDDTRVTSPTRPGWGVDEGGRADAGHVVLAGGRGGPRPHGSGGQHSFRSPSPTGFAQGFPTAGRALRTRRPHREPLHLPLLGAFLSAACVAFATPRCSAPSASSSALWPCWSPSRAQLAFAIRVPLRWQCRRRRLPFSSMGRASGPLLSGATYAVGTPRVVSGVGLVSFHPNSSCACGWCSSDVATGCKVVVGSPAGSHAHRPGSGGAGACRGGEA